MVRVWDSRSGAEQWTPMSKGGPIICCAWSPDGVYLLSGGLDRALTLWDARSGTLLARKTFQASPSSCAFSPTGRLVAALVGSSLFLWNFDAGSWADEDPITEYTFKAIGPKGRCTFSADGRLLAAVSSDELFLIETKTQTPIMPVPFVGGNDCAFSPAADRVVCVGGLYEIPQAFVYDTHSKAMIGELIGNTDLILACDWSADGYLIATGSRDETVKIWDTRTLAEEAQHRNHPFGVSACAWHPEGRTIISAGRDGRLHLWDADTGRWLSTLRSRDVPDGPALTACAYSADGRGIVLVDTQGTVEVCRSTEMETIWKKRAHESACYWCTWSPKGDVIASCGKEGVHVWDATSGSFVGSLANTQGCERLCYSPEGDLLLVDGEDGILVFDANTGESIRKLSFVERFISLHGSTFRHNIDVAPNGLQVVASNVDRRVQIWDMGAPDTVRILAGHESSELPTAYYGKYGVQAEVCCGFLPDGRLLATAYVDGLVKIWDTSDGELVALLASDSRFQTLAVLGDRICLGDDQGYLHLYAVECHKR